MTPGPATAFLFSLERFGMKFGLANMAALCDALGHPERAYPSILIAGTNGKGSVAAMVDAALGAQGYTAGRYTSPHLQRLEERFAIARRDFGLEAKKHDVFDHRQPPRALALARTVEQSARKRTAIWQLASARSGRSAFDRRVDHFAWLWARSACRSRRHTGCDRGALVAMARPSVSSLHSRENVALRRP